MRVFLSGGSGYVGRVVLDRLLRAGHQVVALSRLGTARSLQGNAAKEYEWAEEQLFIAQGDISDPLTLIGAMEGCDAVIHLVGIIREIPGRQITMTTIHARGTKSLVTEAVRCGVKHLVHMSALGARENAVSAYHRSKWASEQSVRESGIPFTIFRPSVIFGKGGPGPNFVDQLRDLVRTSPLVPVIGDGHFLLQPVHIDSVADGFVKSLTYTSSWNKVYEVGGPQQISYLRILETIAESLHKPLRTIRIPLSIMSALIPLLQRLPGFPLTNDQLIMLKEGNICSDTHSFYREFGLEPHPFTL